MTYMELIPVGQVNKIYCPFHQRVKTNEKKKRKKKKTTKEAAWEKF